MPKFNFADLKKDRELDEKPVVSKIETIEEKPKKPKDEITPGEKDQSVAPKKKSDKLHVLTKENLIHFIQEEKRTKLYEMRIRFYKNSLNEIDILIKKLFQENKLTKNKNGWISLKR